MGAQHTISDWYSQYHLQIHEYVRCRVRFSDVDDIAQVTWLRAYRALDRGHCVSSPLSWLYVIAKNTCKDRSYLSLSSSALEEVVEDSSPSVDDVLIHQEECAIASSHLQELHPSYRDILSLRYIYELDNEEIGKLTGLSHTVVKTRVRRGLHLLRKKLEITSLK